MMNKIMKTGEIGRIALGLKQTGKRIVLAGGCFDIIHVGHISFLENAKKAGDVLILLLESDEAIKILKGEKRPINNQENRAKILSAIEFVDYIVTLDKPFRTEDYNQLVKGISPDVIAVTEGDPNLEDKIQQSKESDGKVEIVLEQIPEHSTTKLLDYF